MISILIPHKSTPLNDICLDLNLKMLEENTKSEYEVILMYEKQDPYALWNRYARTAKSDLLIFSNSDVLMAPNWDVQLVTHADNNSIITGYLVECGAIGIASQNIDRNFGRNPSKFDRQGFEDFCQEFALKRQIPDIKNERGWYMPCLMTKEFFSRMGGFPCDLPFPHPNDIKFWEHCLKQGAILKRANSFAYHFQNLSNQEHDFKRV